MLNHQKITSILLLSLLPVSFVFSQEVLATINEFGDHSDLIDTDAHFDEKVKIVSNNEIFMLKLNKKPWANAIVKTNRTFNTLWEYKFPEMTFICSNMIIEDTTILFFSKHHDKEEVWLSQIARKDGGLVSKKLWYTLKESSDYQIRNDFETNGKAWLVELGDNMATIRDFKNKNEISVNYSVMNKDDGETLTGSFDLGVKYFYVTDYSVVGDKIYIIGFDKDDRDNKGDFSLFSYDYKTARLNKVVLQEKVDSKSKVFLMDYQFDESALVAVVLTESKDRTVNLIHYNLATAVVTRHNLDEKKLKLSSLRISASDSFYAVTYIDKDPAAIKIMKIDAKTGKPICNNTLMIQFKLKDPFTNSSFFLANGNLLVCFEEGYTVTRRALGYMGTSLFEGEIVGQSHMTRDVHYYFLDQGCQLLNRDIIEKRDYYTGAGMARNYDFFVGHTKLETSIGVYFFYKPDEKPMMYTLVDLKGNRLKSDVPLTESFTFLKKDMTVDMGDNSFLFFGATQQRNLNGFLKAEYIKIK